MELKLDIKKILKLNMYYLAYQAIFFGLGYVGIYDAFIKNCYGFAFCNFGIVLILQIGLNFLFLLQIRVYFVGLKSLKSRIYNALLSSIVLLMIFNYFLYLVTYPRSILSIILITSNAIYIIISFLVLIRYKKL